MGNGIEGLKFRSSTQKARVVSNPRKGASGIILGCKGTRIMGGKKKAEPPAPIIKRDIPKCEMRKNSKPEIVAGARDTKYIHPAYNYKKGWIIRAEVIVPYLKTNHLYTSAGLPDKNQFIELSLLHLAQPFCPRKNGALRNSQSVTYPVQIRAEKGGKKEIVCETEITVKRPSDETLKGIRGCVKKAKPPKPPTSKPKPPVAAPAPAAAPAKSDDDMFEL